MNNTSRWCYAAMAYEVGFVVVLVEELGYKGYCFQIKEEEKKPYFVVHYILFFTRLLDSWTAKKTYYM